MYDDLMSIVCIMDEGQYDELGDKINEFIKR